MNPADIYTPKTFSVEKFFEPEQALYTTFEEFRKNKYRMTQYDVLIFRKVSLRGV